MKESERIIRAWSCPKEKVNRERNQNGYLDIYTQPYTNTPNEGSQHTSMTPGLFYGHTRTASTSVESDYNNINDVCWQKTQGDIGGGGMKPPASSGVNHSPILAALLHQMRNQANLPPLFWLDNYFPMSDPLWGGILTFEQTQVKEPYSFLPENQGLGQPYLGFRAMTPSNTREGTYFGMDCKNKQPPEDTNLRCTIRLDNSHGLYIILFLQSRKNSSDNSLHIM